jgi:PAS domain S-box-containing protein
MKFPTQAGATSYTPGPDRTDLSSPVATTFGQGTARYVMWLVFLALAYFVAARFGLSLAFVHTNVSPVWPPAGIALAAVLLLGYRVWPGILIGAFFANFLTPAPVAASAVIALGNTGEALLGAYLLRSVGFDNSLSRARDVFKFVVATVICTTVSATVGNLALSLFHSSQWSDFGSLWFTWWLGDLTGAVTLAPLILTWSAGRDTWFPKLRYIEGSVLLLLLSLSAIVTFGKPAPTPVQYYPLARLLIPFLLWAAFRLGLRGVTAAIIVTSAFAVWGTSQGSGPFVSGDPNNALLTLQLFVATNAVTFLFLGAVIAEKRVVERVRRHDAERLAANLAITRILAESPALSDATTRILKTIGETLRWEVGAMWQPRKEGEGLTCLAIWHDDSIQPAGFVEHCDEHSFEPGVGLPSRVWATRKPAWIPDVTKDANFPRTQLASEVGLHGAFAFPILFNQEFLGVMEFFSREIRDPDAALLEMFDGVGKQIGQFVERKRIERALYENEERLRLATQTGRVGVWDWDVVTNHVSWTDSLYSIFGVTKEDFEGTAESFGALVHSDDREAVSKALDESLRTDVPYQIEFRATKPNGETIWLFSSAVVLRNNGVPRRMIGATVDISDIKRAEGALRDNEALYRSVIQALPAAVYTTDAEGRITMFNDAAVEFSGRTPTIGSDSWCVSWKLYWPDGRPMRHDQCPMAITLKTGEAVRGHEAIAERPDGTRVNFVPYPMPLHDSSGTLIGAINMLVDITDRKKVESTFRHYAAIVETTDDAVVSKDLNGIITSWNRAAERLFGYKAEEVIGKPVSILIPSERPDEEPTILARLRRGERIDHYETIRVRKDGQRLHVSLTVSPIKNAEGRIVGASKIARDISEQKRAQEEIATLLASERSAREEAEVANRAKDEFLAVLSHEMRTPLTAMLGWLTILRGHRLDEETTKHAIETVERNAKAQAQLIEDLVDVSRIVGGKLNLEVRPVDLLSVIDASVDVVRPAVAAKQIHLEVNTEKAVPPVSADPARLQQVIWNLLSNAVKFTPKGGTIEVRVSQVESSAEIVIRDNGIGISEDFLPLVFERFRQAESVATRSHRGMGLGLAIVRHLVELHGGTVIAESEGENKGSTFTIRLPLAAVKYSGDVLIERDHKGNGHDHALDGVRILLVEDEPDASELIALVLKGSGAHVEAVDSVGDAMQRMPLFIPDLLLSDIGLPVESGYDLIRKVRSLSTNMNKVPAIALTAFATENDRKKSLSAGFQAHLAKPVEPADLVRTIQTLVNGKS